MAGAPGAIRVALVASTMCVGGAERVTADVVRRLSAERFRVCLFFLHEAGAVGRALFASGFAGVESLSRGRGHVGGLLRLVSQFRSYRPHVVYCLDHHDAMSLGRLAGILTGARGMVVASHATGLWGRKHVFRMGDRVLMDFTSRVVAVSQSHARYLRATEALPASTLEVIENGIDLEAFPPVTPASRAEARSELDLDQDDRVVLMVAAMRPEKAHEALLYAMADLRERGKPVVALLAGDGERRAAIESLAVSLGIRGDVRFLGVRNDVARLLHASDALVLPSRAVVETLPLSVIEAMAVGIPVVASAVGSLPEIIRDGETGFLVPAADAMAVSRRLAYIFEAARETADVARRGSDWVRGRYRIEDTAARYQALFERLMVA